MYEKEFLVWIKHLKVMIISVERVGAKIHGSIVFVSVKLKLDLRLKVRNEVLF